MAAFHAMTTPIYRLCLLQLLVVYMLTPALAQVTTHITSDGSLGTTVNQNGSIHTIDGGTISGTNQFHSFDRFDVGTGDTANFTGPASVENILSRVTGGVPSMIDGTLQSDIVGANLYLLNPSGVMFGPNAQLDVMGSFHVSTADHIQLVGGGRFAADPNPEKSQLTIATPSAFGFMGTNSGSVTIEGSLEVREGEALSVVGGHIHIDGGDLEAPSGWINLIAVTSEADIPLVDGARIGTVPERLDGEIVIGRSSEVAIRGAGGGVFIRGGRLRLENQAAIISLVSGGNEEQGGNVDIGGEQLDLSGGASISTNTFSAPQGGRIIINANRMTVTGNSFIMSDAFSSGSGGEINVRVNESLVIDGETTISSLTRRAGNAGEINIHVTDSLIIDGEATISSSTLRTGDAGKINVDVDKSLVVKGGTTINSSTSGAGKAGNVELSAGTMELNHATITVSGAEGSTGEAGTIHLMADQLSLKGAAMVAAEARGEGDAGEVSVEAMSSMTITGRSTISSSTFGSGAANLVDLSAQTMTIDGSSITANNARRSTGEAGRIALRVDTLSLDNRARITAAAEGTGAGGNVVIDAAKRVTIRGASAITTSAAESSGGTIKIRESSPGLLVELIGRRSNINASVGDGGEEVSGGNIDVMADHVRLQDGASIESTAEGRASGGNVTIKAGDALELESGAFVSSNTFGLGKGGVVSVEADIIRLSDGAILSSGTFGQAAAGGDVKVRARSVVVDKAFIVSDTFGAGSGGDILFEIDRLEVIGEAKISSSSRSVESATGGAGTVTVRGQIEGQLPSQVVITDSAIVTEAERADGGNIEISAGRIQLNNSEITAVSKGGMMTRGGDVILRAKEVVLRSSMVVTNAEGEGADIKILEGVFIADPESVLSATGQVLNNGEVLETGGVVQVLLAFSQPEALESHPCTNRSNRDQVSSFALVGREALPLEPGNVLLSDLSVEESAKRHRRRHTPSQGLRETSSLPIVFSPQACSK